MKKIFFLLLLLPIVISANAQEGKTKKEKTPKERPAFSHEVGLETNNLVSRIFSDGNENDRPDNPYLFTYKLGIGSWALRTGVGGDRKKSVEREEGFADSRTTQTGNLDVRLGLERRFELGEKWTGNVALDGTGFFSENKVIEDSGFDVITTAETADGWGVGPSFGIRFDVTQRLSLYTEGFFYYTFSDVQSARTFKNFPEFDDQIMNVEEEELKISLPSVLYVVFRF